jgi:hypothetical protein
MSAADDVLSNYLPPVATAEQVADILQTTPGALAQDRYLGRGVPFIKVGKRVRYLRADVMAYLEQHRTQRTATAQ